MRSPLNFLSETLVRTTPRVTTPHFEGKWGKGSPHFVRFRVSDVTVPVHLPGGLHTLRHLDPQWRGLGETRGQEIGLDGPGDGYGTRSGFPRVSSRDLFLLKKICLLLKTSGKSSKVSSVESLLVKTKRKVHPFVPKVIQTIIGTPKSRDHSNDHTQIPKSVHFTSVLPDSLTHFTPLRCFFWISRDTPRLPGTPVPHPTPSTPKSPPLRSPPQPSP